MTKSSSRQTLALSIAVAALLSSVVRPALGEAPEKKVKIDETIAHRDKASVTLKPGFEAVKGSNGEVTVRSLTKATRTSVGGTFRCDCNAGGSCSVTIVKGTVFCGGDKCCALAVDIK